MTGQDEREATLRLGAVARRTVLLAGVAAAPLALVACRSSASSSDTATPADEDVAMSAASREAAIIALYDAALAKPDGLGDAAPLLQTIRDQHAEHLAAFGGGGDGGSAPALSSNALAGLRKAERKLAADHAAAAQTSAGEDVTRLLTVVAASESMHAVAIKKAST